MGQDFLKVKSLSKLLERPTFNPWVNGSSHEADFKKIRKCGTKL
jgi:hypothetical protein